MFITISAVGYFQGDEIVYFDRIKDEVIILVLEKERKAKYRQKNQDLLPKLIQSIEWNKDQDSIRDTICYCYSENIE
jgi:hypothetical protein